MNRGKKYLFSEQLKKAFVLVILIPILFLGGFIFYSSHQYIKKQKIVESANIVNRNGIELDNRVEQCENSLLYLTANYTLQEFMQMDNTQHIVVNKAAKSVGALIYNVLLSNQYYKDISIYTENDFHVLTDVLKKADTVSSEKWYQDILKTKDVYWWYEKDTLFIGRKITTAYPVKALGIVVVELKKETFESSFDIFNNLPIQISINDEGETVYQYSNENNFGQIGYEHSNQLADTGWTVQYQVDKKDYNQNILMNFGLPMLIVCIVLLAVWICIRILSKVLVRDLSTLVEEVNEVENGNFDVIFQEANIKEISTLAERIQSMINKIKQLIRQVYTKEIEQQNLELDLLQAKISPHFLYNNLSAINWLALECGEDKISEITTEMATFYRTALNKGNNIDSLSVELTNIKAYVNLQLIAHENLFDIEYEVDHALLSCNIPIFILQPLVENAIEHGIDQQKDGCGKIKIIIEKQEEWLYLRVHDNGTTLYKKIGTAILPVENYGYGTSNVHKRIQLVYGNECGLIIAADESGTTSTIKLIMKYLKKQLNK